MVLNGVGSRLHVDAGSCVLSCQPDSLYGWLQVEHSVRIMQQRRSCSNAGDQGLLLYLGQWHSWDRVRPRLLGDNIWRLSCVLLSAPEPRPCIMPSKRCCRSKAARLIRRTLLPDVAERWQHHTCSRPMKDALIISRLRDSSDLFHL